MAVESAWSERPRHPVPPSKFSPAPGPPVHDVVLGLQRRVGNAAVVALLQRDAQKVDKKTSEPIEVIFIIAKPGDQFTKDMTDYVKTTLKGHTFVPVANLEDICTYLSALAAKGGTVSKVSIVSHGQENLGGMGMTPAGEKKWRFVPPDEVKAYASKPACKGIKAAMAKGGSVEIWGCNIGGVPGAAEAYAGLFDAPIRSTGAEMRVATDLFTYRSQTITSSAQVPKMKNPQASFRQFLLEKYAILSATGEIAALNTQDEQFDYMKDLFDRSKGALRSRVLTRHGSKTPERPGSEKDMELWNISTP
ncbi:MAG TPA: hypothetical protein VIN00_01695 [Candidatus Dormibacteraeota bacterium]